MKITILQDEYWWGGFVHEGIHMPFKSSTTYSVDLRKKNSPNQSMPLFLSSKGRYIWCETPFKIDFNKGIIETDIEVEFEEGFVDLRGAYLAAMKKHFPFQKQIPDERFFTVPQYNTWIELMYDQTQEGIITYAENIIKNQLPAGILMIDEGWAEDYGRYDFRAGAFPNPKGMMDYLHEMGFTVMLWVTPYISPDSAAFRELEKKDYLVKGKDGMVAIRRWWNGYSAILDMTHPMACEWLHNKLHKLMDQYGVDGFKFDGGDPDMYRDDDVIFEPCDSFTHVHRYGDFGRRYRLNEYRAGWKLGGEPLVMRLSDKRHSWNEEGLNMLLPNSILQGLLGYGYHCPDMIGGGEYKNFLENSDKLDQELFVRNAQCAALFPMMQFSCAPWRVLDKKHNDICINMALLHKRFGKKILEMAKNTSITGEPVLRHMAYNYPGKGYETIQDQFMLGDDILVAPVLEKGRRERKIYFPEGVWQGDDGTEVIGPCVIKVDAPLDRLPWYQRELHIE